MEKDKKPYTEKMGKACIVMEIGMVLKGTIDFITNTFYGWIIFGVCFKKRCLKLLHLRHLPSIHDKGID
jgi:hypothetical protein